MTAFESKCVKLWNQGKDTLEIAQILSDQEKKIVHESAVYRAINRERTSRLHGYESGCDGDIVA